MTMEIYTQKIDVHHLHIICLSCTNGKLKFATCMTNLLLYYTDCNMAILCVDIKSKAIKGIAVALP